MQKTAISRRTVIGGLMGLGVAGCGTSPTLDLIGQSFTGFSGSPSGRYPLTAERIRALPYASLGVQVGKTVPVVMILASFDGENLNWASADRVVLVTHQGRLVKTVGLDRDLGSTQWTGTDPVLDYASGIGSVSAAHVNRFIDLRHGDDFGVAVESSIAPIGTERITILDQPYDTIVIAEKISAPKWRWSAENRFWISRSTGQILRSRQSFCPEIAPLTLEILKPAAAAA